MPLPIGRNIEIRNAVRRGLWREPVINFIDEDDLRRASVTRLQSYIERGVVSPGRLEALAGEAAAVKIAKPTRVGDWLTGLSGSSVMQFNSTVASTYYSNFAPLPGPFILSQVIFKFSSRDTVLGSGSHMRLDLRYSGQEAQTAAAFSAATRVFTPAKQSYSQSGFSGYIYVGASMRSEDIVIYPDQFIDLSRVVFNLEITATGNTDQWLTTILTYREVSAVERTRYQPLIEPPYERARYDPPPSGRIRTDRYHGAPSSSVLRSSSRQYRVFLSDREHSVSESELPLVRKWFIPLAIVPEEEADTMRSVVHRAIPVFYKGLQPMPIDIGSTRLLQLKV